MARIKFNQGTTETTNNNKLGKNARKKAARKLAAAQEQQYFEAADAEEEVEEAEAVVEEKEDFGPVEVVEEKKPQNHKRGTSSSMIPMGGFVGGKDIEIFPKTPEAQKEAKVPFQLPKVEMKPIKKKEEPQQPPKKKLQTPVKEKAKKNLLSDIIAGAKIKKPLDTERLMYANISGVHAEKVKNAISIAMNSVGLNKLKAADVFEQNANGRKFVKLVRLIAQVYGITALPLIAFTKENEDDPTYWVIPQISTDLERCTGVFIYDTDENDAKCILRWSDFEDNKGKTLEDIEIAVPKKLKMEHVAAALDTAAWVDNYQFYALPVVIQEWAEAEMNKKYAPLDYILPGTTSMVMTLMSIMGPDMAVDFMDEYAGVEIMYEVDDDDEDAPVIDNISITYEGRTATVYLRENDEHDTMPISLRTVKKLGLKVLEEDEEEIEDDEEEQPRRKLRPAQQQRKQKPQQQKPQQQRKRDDKYDEVVTVVRPSTSAKKPFRR